VLLSMLLLFLKLADHAKILSSKPRGLSEEILDEIEAITSEVLQDFSWSPFDLIGTSWPSPVVGYDPSTAACLEASVAEGGSSSFLYDLTHAFGSRDELLKITLNGADSEVEMSEKYFNPPDYHEVVRSLEQASSNYRAGLGADWVVQGILEPLKLRVITKGPAVLQWLARGLQKAIHSFLRGLPMFEFIGHPVDVETLRTLVSTAFSTFGVSEDGLGPSFVSGDYSAATDKLNINVTMSIFSVLLSKFRLSAFDGRNDLTRFLTSHPAEVLDCLSSLLEYGHLIYRGDNLPSLTDIKSHDLYDFYDEQNMELRVPQLNGQLMGSVLSFPLLCIANFVCVVMASRRMPPEEFGPSLTKKVFMENLWHGLCQINGDDILFPVSGDRMYQHWSSFLPVFGFEKSLGKNWLSRQFFTINSELFQVSSFPHCTSAMGPFNLFLVKMEYFATGLLIGQHKVVGRTQQRNLPMSSVLTLVLKSALSPQRAYDRFLFYNKEWVRGVTQAGMINIGMPIPMGGLGVNLTRFGVHFTQTRLQRAVALEAMNRMFVGDVKVRDYSRQTVHFVSQGARLDSRYTLLPNKFGIVTFRPSTISNPDVSEIPLDIKDSMSIGPLAYRKLVRDNQDDLLVSGAGIFRSILKKHLPHGVLKKGYDFDSFEVLSLQRVHNIPMGSEDSSTKTVGSELINGVLNNSVPTKDVLFFPSWVDQESRSSLIQRSLGVSRDCTVDRCFSKWVWNRFERDLMRAGVSSQEVISVLV